MPDDKRINESYFKSIDEEMAEGHATIKNAVDAMRARGNGPYIMSDPLLKPKIQMPLSMPVRMAHDMSHLSARLGLSPQQEQWTAVFEMGLTSGWSTHNASSADIAHHRHQVPGYCTENRNEDKKYFKNPESANIEPPNDRHIAVYYAAGMYLREKIEHYKQAKSYNPFFNKQKYLSNYANTDTPNTPLAKSKIEAFDVHDNFLVNVNAPYELLTISRAEWRAITEVALGLREPEETRYPNRLKPIKETLQNLGYAYDIKPHVIQAVQEEENPEKPNGKKRFEAEHFISARNKETRTGPERFINNTPISRGRD